jgi:hypothetical protein
VIHNLHETISFELQFALENAAVGFSGHRLANEITIEYRLTKHIAILLAVD